MRDKTFKKMPGEEHIKAYLKALPSYGSNTAVYDEGFMDAIEWMRNMVEEVGRADNMNAAEEAFEESIDDFLGENDGFDFFCGYSEGSSHHSTAYENGYNFARRMSRAAWHDGFYKHYTK
jgi:hypothetical protein